jgi:hypothetical protein
MKNPSTFTPCKPKKYIGAMLSLLIGCMQFLFLKLLVIYFGIGYWLQQKNYGVLRYWRTYWGVLTVICVNKMGVPPMFRISF